MKKDEIFSFEGATYRCQKDDIKIEDGKLKWSGQQKILIGTALKKKGIEKLADVSRPKEPDLFEEDSGIYEVLPEVKRKICSSDEKKESAAHKSWFIQVDEMNLPTYFTKGILAPVDWIKYQGKVAQRSHDLQSYQPGCLIILPGIMEQSGLGNAALEICLTAEEQDEAEKDDFYCFAKSLPASRIIKIHYRESAGTPGNIHARYVYPDVLIPKEKIYSDFGSLPTIPGDKSKVILDKIRGLSFSPNSSARVEVDVYDRLLGAMAMLRTAGYFFTKSEKTFSEYPASVNTLFKVLEIQSASNVADVLFSQVLTDAIVDLFERTGQPDPLIAALHAAVYAGEVINKDRAREIAKESHSKRKISDIATEALRSLFKEDSYKQCMSKLKHAPDSFPFIALAHLYKFHNKESNDSVNLFSWVGADLIDSNTASYVLGLMGAYYGYSRLHAFVDVDDMEPDLKIAAGGSRLPIKFGGCTALEFSILEQIHKLAFPEYKVCKSSAGTFDQRSKKTMPSRVENLSYEIEGTEVAVYRVNGLADKVADLVRTIYPARICHHEFAVATCIAQLWPNYGAYPCLGPYDREDLCHKLTSLSPSDLQRVQRYIAFDRKENMRG